MSIAEREKTTPPTGAAPAAALAECRTSPGHLSVRDYLAAEWACRVRHEYVGGTAYALVGARNLHNIIKGNIFGVLFGRLRGKRCRPFDSDTKVRIRLPEETRFYYPDVQVTCRPGPPDEVFQDEPTIVVEVLSRSTRRLDEGEKKDGYLRIPSLSVYLLVEQEKPLVSVHRRTDQGFVREAFEGLEAVVPLPEIEAELPLKEIYEAVEFTPEPDPAE